MADEKIPQNQHDDPDQDWDTQGMRGMAPPQDGLKASRIDLGGRQQPPGGGIPLQPGWQQGYFYAEGMEGRMVLVPGSSVEAHCDGGLSAGRESLMAAFAERGLDPPGKVYLVYPSDPMFAFFEGYDVYSDGGRTDFYARYAHAARERMADKEGAAQAQMASMPGPLADGNEAHKVIAEWFRKQHGVDDVGGNIFTNSTPMGAILKQISLNGIHVDKDALSESELRMRPDLVNARLLQLWEIKPFSLSAEGIAEALHYQSLFHKAAVKAMQLGPMTDPGVTGRELTSRGELVWGSPAPGLVLYEYLRPPQGDPVPDPVGDPVNRPVPVLPWAPGGRQRVTTPEHMPLAPSAPEGTSLLDLDYWKKVTGFTSTAAVLIYLLISEGSRLFPPRNLIPIP